jgi:hypothetical protein
MVTLDRFPLFQSVEHALEDQQAIVRSKDGFTRAFRMRHEAGDVARFIANARDIFQ